MPPNSEDNVSVQPMRFGNRRARKQPKKVGRPLKYPQDPKRKISVSIRESIIEGMGDQNRTQFLEDCVLSSMDVPAKSGILNVSREKKE